MDKELKSTLVEITRAQDTFRRDENLLTPQQRAARCAANISPCENRRKSSDNCCEHYPLEVIDNQHKPICAEYWDRGLDCDCIPEGVKRDIRNGAKPEDVM